MTPPPSTGKALRFLPVLLVWSALYAAFDLLVLGLSQGEVLHLVIAKDYVYLHLWYLSMFACLLAFAPFLARLRFAPATSKASPLLFFGLITGFVFADWLLAFVCEVTRTPFIYWLRTFLTFIPYFLLGMFLVDPRVLARAEVAALARFRVVGLVLALVASWLANFAVCRFFGLADDTIPLGYHSPFVFAVALALFLVVQSSAFSAQVPGWLRAVAEASFGIYLLHPLFIWLFRRLSRGSEIDPVGGLWMPVTAMVVFALSFLCIHLLRRLPLGSRLC